MLRDKYTDVLNLHEKLGIEAGTITEAGGKLHIGGHAAYQYDADRLWNAIKAHPGWEQEVQCEIDVVNHEFYGQYKVKPGDTLSAISKRYYGTPNRYQEIFELNKDILDNPDRITAGEEIRIPNK